MLLTLRIGEVAGKAGVNVQTLRFYERRGLLKAPARRESGYRAYQPDAVGTVRFIKRAQDLGFSLREVKELLSLKETRRSCQTVRRAAQSKLDAVEVRLRRLTAMRNALTKLIATCGEGDQRACPILEALDDDHAPRGSR